MKKMNKVIALLMVMLMLLSSTLFSLSSCVGGGQGDNNENENNGGQNGGGDNEQNVTYSITVVTKGGMLLKELPIYLHLSEDTDEIVGYAVTDEIGKATFSVPSGDYVISISLEGYDVNEFYPVVSNDMSITVTSSVIPDTSLVGVSYSIGSVMHDFTVDSKILVKNEEGQLVFKEEKVTLSELLKEKDAVLLNFWYVDCPACQMEFPYMQSVYENYSDDVAIIALDPLYDQDTIYDIDNFQSSYGLTFNVGQDLNGIAAAFGVDAYPTSVMIDRYGVVTLIHKGAITGERPFNLMFDAFVGDNYVQKLVYDVNTLVPKEEADVEMPPVDEFADAFEKDDLGNINYHNDEDDKFSWPFTAGEIEDGDKLISCVYPTNAKKEGSYAQLLFDIELKAGEALAFDYFSSTELGADILYVVVDGKDIYSISGESTEWQTCYAYVAEETATYSVGIVYAKDSSADVGADTVYLKDLRIISEADVNITQETYIYRFAATNPDEFSNYQDYVDVFLGDDGYYHVGSKTGPILLADLMGYTRFSDESAVYYMASDLISENRITTEEYNKIIEYCNYASNSSVFGVCSVTPELKGLLDKIVYYYGNPDNENDWLRLCCYYDAYGTGGKQLVDPIKGLSFFSAYEVVESESGSTDFPNSFTYDRLIMPRGLLGKFTPTESGTYLIVSNTYNEETNTHAECNAWIFVEGENGARTEWLTYDNVDRFNTTDNNNCYMVVYLEKGKNYYIDIAYYDVYGEGTINYRVERLGDEGYFRFSLASPPFFTTLESVDGDITGYIISGGIDLELGKDGIWREKRTDGRVGSIIYADFTMKTPLFSHSILEMIDHGAFDFSRTENDQYILNCIDVQGGVEECDKYLRNFWGEDYAEYAEIYKVEEVYDTYLNGGNYHGTGTNYTDTIKKYIDKIIVEGYNEQLGEEISAIDKRIGCVVVTEELAEILQLIMNKYTFMNGTGDKQTPIENSWAKLCYYTQYFCAATPK